jgi:ketosteroid isomerase-like protein
MTSNLEIVQAAYKCFGEGDIAGLLDLWGEPADWQSATGLTADDVPYAGKRQGKAALLEFFGILANTIDIHTFEPREFNDAGDTVIVLGYVDSTYKATGKKFDGEWVHVIRLKDGKAVSFQEFDNTAGLKEAATP